MSSPLPHWRHFAKLSLALIKRKAAKVKNQMYHKQPNYSTLAFNDVHSDYHRSLDTTSLFNRPRIDEAYRCRFAEKLTLHWLSDTRTEWQNCVH